MYLSTVGITKNVIERFFSKLDQGAVAPPPSLWGKNPHPKKLSAESIRLIHAHIDSYHPSVSHYRREHAPNRLYLDPTLTILAMYADFISKHPNICGLTIYWREVRAKNISFVKLGEEECEECLLYQNHVCSEEECQSDGMGSCSILTRQEEHKLGDLGKSTKFTQLLCQIPQPVL